MPISANSGSSTSAAHGLKGLTKPEVLYQLTGPGLRDQFPPIGSGDALKGNLPAAIDTLIGRDELIRRVTESVATHRLVTLVASGGVGKTSLALAVADTMAERWQQLWLVDLSVIDDEASVAPTVAMTLGMSLTNENAVLQIARYLSDKRFLIVLDNCEHVVGACAELAESFLRTRGESVIVATSRERLGVKGEFVIAVPPLSVDGDGSAIELFLDRAAAADPAFSVADQDRQQVESLCAHLDGVPLAIELAAARTPVLTVEQLIAGLVDRFSLLKDTSRRNAERTLETTLDWSYQLLDDRQRQLLRSLGVMEGSCDLRTASAIVAQPEISVADDLQGLVAKSFVVSCRDGNAMRFALFETTKAYALDRLREAGEEPEAWRRLADHYTTRCAPFGRGIAPDARPREVLLPDRASVVATVQWLQAAGEWDRAATLLLDAGHVLHDRPGQMISLVRGNLDGLGTDAPMLSGQLRVYEWLALVQTWDFQGCFRVNEVLEASDVPAVRAMGLLLTAFVLASFSFERCNARIERSLPVIENVDDPRTAVRAHRSGTQPPRHRPSLRRATRVRRRRTPRVCPLARRGGRHHRVRIACPQRPGRRSSPER